MTDWPRGEQPGPACPENEAGDTVKMADTKGCTVASLWAGMCPCAAVLGGWDDAWRGFDAEGNELPRHASRRARNPPQLVRAAYRFKEMTDART